MARTIRNLLRSLRRLVRPAYQAPPKLRDQARSYWTDCDDSFLVKPEYYETVERELESLAGKYLTGDDVIADYGCGNGRFTLQLAKHCRQIHGLDISGPLIDEANALRDQRGIANATFERHDLEQGAPDRGATVIVCQGVFSCILDDAVFNATLRRYHDLLPPGGRLILRDTLASESQHIYESDYGYVANYRLVADYEASVTRAGFRRLERVHLLTKRKKKRINYLYVFERR